MTERRGSRHDLLATVCQFHPGPGGSHLPNLCRLITGALDARWCALRLPDGAEFSWPDGSTNEVTPRSRREISVMMGTEEVGTLALEAADLRGMTGSPRSLLADLIDALGPVLLAVRLEQALVQQVRAGRENAERVAAALRGAFVERDEERRVLERDLHDGAQHHLVALRVTIALLEQELAEGQLPSASASLRRLAAQVAQAEQVLLDTAAGVCPPVLVDQGLVEALRAEFSATARTVELTVSGNVVGRRFPLVVETTTYFTCLEAVNNANKHAPYAQVVVSIGATAQGLAFSIADDGPGIAPSELPGSFGLDNMRARVVAAGGKLTVSSGSGTKVEGFIPI